MVKSKMLWRGAAVLSLASAALFDGVVGQVITITEYASVCSAVYTTGSKSVTVVQSTVTVEPVPWTDAAANSGTPFIIAIQFGVQSRSLRKRQSQPDAYLTADGNTTADVTLATQYSLTNGQLSSIDGRYISTTSGTPYEPFAVSSTLGSISTTFAVVNTELSWKSSAFDNGDAQFYSQPAGVVHNAQIIAKFSGAVDPSWALISLYTMPGMLLWLLRQQL